MCDTYHRLARTSVLQLHLSVVRDPEFVVHNTTPYFGHQTIAPYECGAVVFVQNKMTPSLKQPNQLCRAINVLGVPCLNGLISLQVGPFQQSTQVFSSDGVVSSDQVDPSRQSHGRF